MRLRRFKFEKCLSLSDSAYYIDLVHQLEAAQFRIWINMFYIGITPKMDRDFLSRRLFDVLLEKVQDGLNVKLLLGTSRVYSPLEIQNGIVETAYGKHLPTRFYSGTREFSHRKYVLIDEDTTLLGSHNWSHRSMKEGRDDSVRIVSGELTEYLSDDFHRNWIRTNEPR